MNYKNITKRKLEGSHDIITAPTIEIEVNYCSQNTENIEESLSKIRNRCYTTTNELCFILYNIRVCLLLSNDQKIKCDYEQMPFPIKEFIGLLYFDFLTDETKGVILDILYYITKIEKFDYESLFSEDFYEMLIHNFSNAKLRNQSLNLIGNFVMDSKKLCLYFINHGILDEIKKDFYKPAPTFMFQWLLNYIPIDYLEIVGEMINSLISCDFDELINVRGLECLLILFNRGDIQCDLINLGTFYKYVPSFINGQNPKRLYKALKTCLYLTKPPNILEGLIQCLNSLDIKTNLLVLDILIHFVDYWKTFLSNEIILNILPLILKGSYDVIEKGIAFVHLYYIIDNNLDNNIKILNLYISYLESDFNLQISCLYGIEELVDFCKVHFLKDEFSQIIDLLLQKKDVIMEILESSEVSNELTELSKRYLDFLNDFT